MKVYLIKKSVVQGFDHEVEYLSHEEAKQAIAKILAKAKERDVERAAWLAAHPKPWSEEDATRAWIHGYDTKFTNEEQFYALGYHVVEKDAAPTVYRLNTLPANSPEMRREIEAKVMAFGGCDICWTCTGHARSAWQSEAACDQLRSLYPQWEVNFSASGVSIKAKKDVV